VSQDPLYEKQLLTEVLDPAIADNPLAYVMFMFPWGRAGTPLEKFSGPRQWQKDELLSIRDFIGENKIRAKKGDPFQMYHSATASGRGIGKSALVAWLIHWMMCTRLGSTTIVAANSEAQLKGRTWAELGKWHTLSMTRHWLEKTALSLRPMDWLGEALKNQMGIDTTYFYAAASLWTEENPDSFAGVHNHYGEMVIFDEASGIPAPIWTVTEGFFSDPIADRYWLCFSNPRRNTGAFFDCFHDHKSFWKTRNLDSRSVEGTDHVKLQQIVDKYGSDSDEARIEVKGEFPQQGDRQFISRDLIDQAFLRDPSEVFDNDAALYMGVDPARFGSDETVILFRKGRSTHQDHVPPVERFKGMDNMAVADRCAYLINKYNPDAVCIDAGNGTGIIDRLRQRGYRVHEVGFGTSAENGDAYANKRTELWARMRDWLAGAVLASNNHDLLVDLGGPEYKFMGSSDKLMLETKDDMKKRKIKSPDDGDALACTFFVNVPHRGVKLTARRNRVAAGIDYDLFSGE